MGIILITGATGFVGSHLSECLIKKDFKLRSLTRKTSNVSHLKKLGIDLVFGDLNDEKSLHDAVKGVSIVIHSAALMSNYDWLPRDEYYRVNVTGTKNLLESCIKEGIEHFIHISSTGVYGETGAEPAKENHPYGNDLSDYEWSKCEAEKMVLEYQARYKIPVTILRLAQLYGSRMLYGWLNTAKRIKSNKMRIVGMGNGRIQPTHIKDVLQACLPAIKNKNSLENIYNIAGKEIVTIREVFNLMSCLIKADPPKSLPYLPVYGLSLVIERLPLFFRKGDLALLTSHRIKLLRQDRIYCIDKAKKELGYSPSIGLRDGMEEMINWFVSNKYL